MNITQAIVHIYPNAVPMKDFIVQDDSNGNGPYIKGWKYSQPQPTQQELEAAWELIKNTPPQPTIEERLQATEEVLTSLMGI